MTTQTRSKLLLPKLLLLAAFSVLGLTLSGRTAHAAITATIAYAQASLTTATLTATVSGGVAGDHYTYTFSQVGTTPGTATGFSPVANTAATSATNTITVNTRSASKNDYTFQVIVMDLTTPSSDTKTTTATVQAPILSYANPGPIGTQAGHNSAALTLMLSDQFFDPLTFSESSTITWSVQGSPAGTSVNPTTGTITTASPTATTTFTTTSPGTFTVVAMPTGFGNPVFSVTADAPPTVTSLAAAVNANETTGTLTTTASTTIPSPGNTLTYAYVDTVFPAGHQITGIGANATQAITFPAMGAYTFQVTVTDSLGQTTTATSNNVTVSQVLTSIIVTPATPTVDIADTDQFTAVADDQFGAPLTTQPGSFTWSKTAGTGTVNGSGVFTAPATLPGAATQTDTVQAMSGAVHGMGNVTVDDVAPTVMTAAAANPNPVTAKTTLLSALGAYTGGESNLTYTWSDTGPAGAPAVTYSDNGTNTAQNCTATFARAGSYTFTVTIKDPSNLTVTSQVTVMVDQTFTSISATPASPTVAVGGADQITAVALDQFGSALAPQPAFTYAVISGNGTVSASGLLHAPTRLTGNSENDTVQAMSGGITGTTTVTVTDSAPTVATPAAATPSPVTATTTALSVLGAYAGGESNLIYTWSVTSAPVGAPAVTFSGAVNGTNAAKNLTATFGAAGSYTFTVTIADPANNAVTSQVTVTVDQTPTSISVTPASPTVSVAGTDQFTATALDQFGSVITGRIFAWSVTAGTGTVSPSGGLFTAPNTIAGTSETDTVQAVSGGIAGTGTVTVSNVAPTVATPASASPNAVAGTTTALSVLGAYAGGESNLKYTWAVTGPAGVTFSGAVNGTNAAKNITATFGAAGTYTFTVSIAAPSISPAMSSVVVVVDATFTSISLTPASPTVSVAGTDQFTAVALDQFGAALAPQPAFTYSVTAGTGTVSASGLFTAPSTISGNSETDTVHAVSGGITGTATITVADAVPTVMAAATATPNPVTATTTALSVLGAYAGGESHLTYAWTVSPSAGVSLPASGTNASKNITATFTAAGTYAFTVTITDPSGASVTSTVNVTVVQTLTTITATPAMTSVIVGGTDQFSAVAKDQFGNLLAVQPVFSWNVTSGTGTVNVATGLFAAPNTLTGVTTEVDTVQAASGGVAGTAMVTVNESRPTVAVAAAANPSAVIRTTTALSILGAYAGGESNLTYTWAQTSGPAGATFSGAINGTNAAQNITVTFAQAGTYVFTATIKDPSGTAAMPMPASLASVTVTVSQTLTAITVSPATVTVDVGGAQPFAASATDQFGNAITGRTFAWSVISGTGTIDAASGRFAAPDALAGNQENDTVQAKIGAAAVTGTATVTVTDTAPTVAVAAAAAPNLVAAKTSVLSVLGAYAGGEPNLKYTWSYAGPTGVTYSSSTNGANAAKTITANFTQAGVYTFTVTIADPSGKTVTSVVNVTVAQTLTTITVTPAAPSVSVAAADQFTAIGFDQFGAQLTTQPLFTWTVTAGTGTVNAAGLFVAPGSLAAGKASETDTVQAANGSVTGAANAIVGDVAPTIAPGRAATAAPNPVARIVAATGAVTQTGKSTALSVLGAYAGGESRLTYTWSDTGPLGAPAVAYSDNGTNTAKNCTASFALAGTYTFTVTISDPSGTSVTSQVVVTVEQTPTAVSVRPAAATVMAGSTGTFTATVTDQFGTIIPAPSVTVAWSAGRGTATTPGASTTYTAPSLIGNGRDTLTATVTNANGTIVAGSAAVAVTTQTASKLAVVVSPSIVAEDTPFPVTVIAEDKFGNVVTNYVGKIAFTSSDVATGVFLPAAYTFVAGDHGQHTFAAPDDVTLITPGAQTITVKDTANSGITGAATVTVTGFLSLSPAVETVGDPAFTTFTVSGTGFAGRPGAGGALTDNYNQTLALQYIGRFDPSGTQNLWQTLINLWQTLIFNPATALGNVKVDSPTLLTVSNLPDETQPVTQISYGTTIPFAGRYLVEAISPVNAKEIVGVQTLEVTPLPPPVDSSRPASTSTEASATESSASFAPGLHMVSAPFDYAAGVFGSSRITDVFKLLDFSGGALATYDASGPALRFAVWQPAASSYVITSAAGGTAADTLRIGQGYWVRFPAKSAILGTADAEPGLVMRGSPASADAGYVPSTGQYKIALTAGWNMIGDPFSNSVQLSNFQVATATAAPVSLIAANGLSIVSDTLYSYDYGNSVYDSFTPSGIPNDDTNPYTGSNTNELVPYAGYWILAYQPCTLYVSSN